MYSSKFCHHQNASCINPYELIRKYHCSECSGVMICECIKDIGLNYLPHQLDEGCFLKTQETVKVNLGFQPAICSSCRGIEEISAPLAETYGNSSKFQRYYWYEIFLHSTRLFGQWCEQNNYKDWFKASQDHHQVFEGIKKQSVLELKQIYEINPKYDTKEETTDDIILNYKIEVIKLNAKYVKSDDRKAKVEFEGHILTVEKAAELYFKEHGYNVVFLESRPFHALFAILCWLLIQDPSDEKQQLSYFGDRNVYEKTGGKKLISCFLPTDFGSSGYFFRREADIKEHLESIVPVKICGDSQREELLWLFDYWTEHSNSLRQYLWAHKEEHIVTARKLIEILEPVTIVSILRALLKSYWDRYLGWPDLLVYSEKEYFFVEVKSANDKLSNDQKNWIKLNDKELKLPYKIFKLLKDS